MSHINDALKKAQEEKDSIYQKYGRIISTPSKGKRQGKGPWSAALLLVTIVFLLSGFYLARYVAEPTDTGEERSRSVEKGVQKERVLEKEGTTPLAKISEKPSDAETLYRKALVHQKKNDYDRAERLYRTILNRDPEFVLALNNLGVIYMGTKRDDEAKAMFEKAIEHSEDYVDPYYNLACIYSKRGDATESLDYLKAAIKLNNSVKKWVKNDKDLENVSSLKEFREITE